MEITLIAAVLVPLLAGFSLSATLLLGTGARKKILLAASLSPSIGILICSVLYFAWSLIYSPAYQIQRYILLESIILIGFSAVLWFTWFGKRSNRQSHNNQPHPKLKISPLKTSTLLGVIALFIFCISLVFYLNDWLVQSISNPDGDWDSWAIWNLRARFIFSGEYWREGFSSAIHWSHPDYPILLPLSIARIWVLLGNHNQVVSNIIGLVFVISCLSVLMTAVGSIRGWKSAVIAGLFIIPVFSTALQWKQYADLPIGFYFLFACIMFFFADSASENYSGALTLGGFATGAALWTKNEGWAFLLGVAAVEIYCMVIRKRGLHDTLLRIKAISIGFLPIFVTVLLYKYISGQQNDIISSFDLIAVVSKITDISRYLIITSGFVQTHLADWGHKIPFFPFLFFYVLLVSFGMKKEEVPAIILAVLRILITGMVYFGIYLLTPHDLVWHIGSSMGRLAMQLIPSIIFIALVSSKTIGENIATQTGSMVVSE